MKRIVTLTMNPAVDLTAKTDHVSPDRKLRVGEVRREPGGGGVNVARVVHELGGDVVACFVAGGPNGDLLEDLIEDRGVPRRRIAIDGHTRQDVTITDESGDRQYRFVMPGPEVDDDDCRRALDAVLGASPELVVASGSLPPGAGDDLYARLAAACRSEEIELVVDTSGNPLARALDEGVFLVKPNLRELADLAGRDIEDDRDLEEVARRLVDDGRAQVVAASLGGGGMAVVDSDGCRLVRAPSVKVRSKVGAGDSAVGGLVLALARGDDLADAARWAVAAGAAAVTTPGTELCRAEDVERLVSRMHEG